MNQFGHYLFFGLTSIWLSLILFYQVLVNPGYQRFSWRQFLSPDFFIQVLPRLRFQPPILGKAAIIDPAAIAVDCDNFCQFKLKDKIIPAQVEIDAAGRLKDLTLNFFDSQAGLIGYQDKSSEPTFYVINSQAELLQVIRLVLNHQVKLTFQNYYPDSQRVLFQSDLGESFLYSANKPALQLL